MKDYSEMFPEWKPNANYCGANRYVAGDVGDDFDAWNNIQVYYNLAAKCYYLDQDFPTDSIDELIEELKVLLAKLYLYKEKMKDGPDFK